MPPAAARLSSAASSSADRRMTRSSRWVSSSSGGRSTSARVRTAVRSRPMVAEAWMPWPTTSPTTRATRAPDSGITSNQSPPTPARRRRAGSGWRPHGRLVGQALRQQAALQGQGGGVLAGVAAGVVDADGRAAASSSASDRSSSFEGLRRR